MYEMTKNLVGMEIICDPLLTETVQYSRSPSRAKRRMKRGFPQHYRKVPCKSVYIDNINNRLICHPAVLAEIKASIQRKMDEVSTTIFNGLINDMNDNISPYDNTLATASKNVLTAEKLNDMMKLWKEMAKPKNYRRGLQFSAITIESVKSERSIHGISKPFCS